MGGQESKCSERGSFFIDLAKPSFFSGEFVQGTINLKSEGYESNKIFLVLTGEEKLKMQYKHGKNTRYAKAKEPIFQQVIDIYYFEGGKVPPGQFQFPFSVQLPKWFPPSFFWKFKEGDEKYKCQIRYKLKAYAVDNTGKDKPIYGKRVLLVSPNPPPPSRSQEMKNKTEVTTCCIVN